MKITVIHGQAHKGSTYNITKQIIDKIKVTNKEIDEYFMPNDTPNYCIGCYKCFNESEYSCPHNEKVQRIVSSMKESDIIIMNSPTYCLGMTGQLGTFLNHLGYMWLSHRPSKAMFNKVGIVVSSTAGAGAEKITKALKEQMFWIGIPKVIKCNKRVNADSWETVPEKIKASIDKDTSKIATKAETKVGNTKPSFRLKFMFNIMRMMQKANTWSKVDRDYWKENGWLDKNRPWKA